jgi:hypothetical protein
VSKSLEVKVHWKRKNPYRNLSKTNKNSVKKKKIRNCLLQCLHLVHYKHMEQIQKEVAKCAENVQKCAESFQTTNEISIGHDWGVCE